MIQFNKTFFQFTKRFALVCTLIGMSSTAFALSHDGTHTTEVSVSAHPTAAGKVYIRDYYTENYNGTTKATQSCNFLGSNWNSADTQTFYMLAEGTPTEEETKSKYPYLESTVCLWDQWSDGLNYSNKDLEPKDGYIIQRNEWDNEDKDQTISRTLTAYWITPKITTVTPTNDAITVVDPSSTQESVSFLYDVSEAKSDKNFEFWILENVNQTEDIVLKIGNITTQEAEDKDYISKITVPINYTPTGVHNLEGTIYHLRAASKYIGLDSNNKPNTESIEKESVITIKEDYRPQFVMQELKQENTSTNTTVIIPLQNINKAAASQNASWTCDISNKEGFADPIKKNDNIEIEFSIDDDLDQPKTYYTTLTVTCTYNDKRRDSEGKPSPTPGLVCTKTCVIEVTLQPSGTSILTFKDLDNQDITEINFNKTYPNGDSKGIRIQKAKVSNIVVSWDGISNSNSTIDGALTFEQSDLNVVVKLNENTKPGNYLGKLKVSAMSTIPDQTVSPDYIDVTANVTLQPINLNAYPGDGCAYLEWNEVPGATEYKIEWTGTASGNYTVNKDQLEVTIDKLNNSTTTAPTEYCFQVTAVYSPNTKYNSISDKICVEPRDLVTEITETTAPKTGIFTGTEHAEDSHPMDGTFPYMTKRNIDVSAAFGDEGPLFDKLVIFGLTTNINNEQKNKYHDLSDITKAKTPCYIYIKQGDKYVLSHIGEGKNIVYQFVDNMNTSAKDPNYNIEGDNVYFTGYCPSTSTGNTWDHNGGAINAGSLGHAKEIYLDNLQLYARNTTKVHSIDKDSLVDDFLAEGTDLFMKGSGAAIAIYGNGVIHISGNNVLQGSYGMTFESTNSNLKVTYEQESSPIQCYKLSNERAVLSIDDKWNNNNTNGSLKFSTNHTRNPLLIDLGNTGNLTLGGGQIYFNNKSNTQIVGGITASVETKVGSKQLYGAANGSVKNNESTADKDMHYRVFFNDGTYYATYPLVCPLGYSVDGGSYICNFADTPKNEKGKDLFKIAANISSEIGTINDNGLVSFSVTGFDKLLDNIFPKANYMVTTDNNTQLFASLKGYYATTAKYKHESLSAPTGAVYLYLPRDAEAQISGWAICKPKYEITQPDGTTVTEGGTIEQELLTTPAGEPVPSEKLIATTKLLYTTIDDISKTVFESSGAATIQSLEHYVFNEKDYTISDKIYMLLPVISGQWKMIVPPFDVHNVYIIESCPEEYLKEKYGTEQRYGGKKIIGEGITRAREEQATRTMALIALWGGDLEENNKVNDEDFFGSTENSYGSFVTEWMNEYVESKPIIKQVYHYTGNNGEYPTGMKWWDANYYLYTSPSKIWTATSEQVEEENKVTFGTDWDYVRVQSKPHGNTVIMQRGEVYTMQFPATVGTTYNDWNYWTGKYILLEGFGPQTIYGSESAKINLSTITEPSLNYALLAGNASFAAPTVSSEILFNLEENNNKVWDFVRTGVEEGAASPTPSHKLLPMEGFLFANVDIEPKISTNEQGQTIQTQKIAKAIKMETGEVMYEVKTEIIDNGDPGLGSGVPTIMNGMTLIVEPTSEGLTITPIKEQHVMLFDADGKMIFSKHLTAEENVTLPTGVYVVRGEYEQVKAIKK